MAHFALALGLSTSHTMVPPTPGPVLAAGLIGADLGLAVGYGALVSVTACLAGWRFCALWPPPAAAAAPGGGGVADAELSDDGEPAVPAAGAGGRAPAVALWRALVCDCAARRGLPGGPWWILSGGS